MDHREFLSMLLTLRKAQSVHLVSRLTIRNANLTEGKLWVFVPDLHLLTRSSARGYKYSFAHDTGFSNTKRHTLLTELGKKIESLKRGQERDLFVYQLGDFVDIWRENRVAEIEDLASLARRVLADNPAARDYLADASSLATSLTVGNHDHVGSHSLLRDDTFRRMKVTFSLPSDGSVMVTHGDLFDPIEGLPDRWSRWGARFTSVIASGTHDLSSARRIQQLKDVPGRLAVLKDHKLMPGAIKAAKAIRRGQATTLKPFKLARKRPVKIFVIGHTHHAAMALKDGVVVMDCGAWLERCKIGRRIVPSCQIGVIAKSRTGADLRIYQLTPA